MENSESKLTHCGKCRNYLALSEPFHYEKAGYPDGVTVYGFCAKDSKIRGSFYPVYIPDGGICNSYKVRRQCHE